MENRLFFILIGAACLSIIVSVIAVVPYAQSSVAGVPPTPAFDKITLNDQVVRATTFDETLFMNFTGSLSVEKVGVHEVTITLDPIDCPDSEMLKGVNSSGFLYCGKLGD